MFFFLFRFHRNGDLTPPEGFCIGVLAFLPSVQEVPSTFNRLQESFRRSLAPGAILRLLAILPPSTSAEDLSNPSLSSIYLASVLYLVGRNRRTSLHRIHPFTGAVRQIYPDSLLFPSPLQVLNTETNFSQIQMVSLIQLRTQRVGSSLRSLSPSLRSHRTQKRKTGESSRETALIFASLTLLLISTTSQ